MIEPTSLDRLVLEDGAVLSPRGLRVVVRESWVVPGENRLSYVSLVRLIECCREHHWNVDVVPNAAFTDPDCTLRAMRCEFRAAAHVGHTVAVTYRVARMGTRSYTLDFTISREGPAAEVIGLAEVVCVFYDAVVGAAVEPCREIAAALRALAED